MKAHKKQKRHAEHQKKPQRQFREHFEKRFAKPIENKTPARPPRETPTHVVGVIVKTKFGWGLEVSDRRDKNTYVVRPSSKNGKIPSPLRGGLGRGENDHGKSSKIKGYTQRLAPTPDPSREGRGNIASFMQGELVAALVLPSTKQGRREVRITHHLGDPDDPRNISLIAIRANEIPDRFSEAALKEADEAKPVNLPCHPRESGDPVARVGGPYKSEPAQSTRTDAPHIARGRSHLDSRFRGNDANGEDRVDLTGIPLVTIDGPDARDFDDAVFAERDKDGWHLIVAIADVAHYVKPGSALDQDAYERGNSTYFPDRVVPMLPEKLSNGLCSLMPNVDRACIACHMWIDKEGELTRWQFVRGVMKSRARLTYEQVQAAHDGKPDKLTAPLLEQVIKPLYDAYDCLMNARVKRGTLELDLPERKVELNEDGTVAAIKVRERLDSHKLIEEFMICANVAAAAQLEGKGGICIYRVHDKPSEIKLEALRDFLASFEISLVPHKQLHPRMLTHILEMAAGGPNAQVINEVMLRSQAQAVYSPDNIGHFGLALAKYAHFTSPIRRYADLIVHRALIRTGKLGDDGLTDREIENLEGIAEHISQTERRSITAERDAIDRYTTLFLADKIDVVFSARISGVARFGLFARLDDTGADGMIPFNALPRDFYHHDEKRHALVGQRTKREYQLGMPVKVRLDKADKLTGSLGFTIVEENNGSAPQHSRRFKSKQKRNFR